MWGKKKTSFSGLKVPSIRSKKEDRKKSSDVPAVALNSSQVILSGRFMSNPDLGAPMTPEQQREMEYNAKELELERLKAQLVDARKRLAEAAAPAPRSAANITKKLEALQADADAPTARSYILEACGAKEVTLPVLTALLVQLSKNAAFKFKLTLPDDEGELRKYSARVFTLADIDRDAILNPKEFKLLWHNLPSARLEAESILGKRYDGKMVAPASTFKFGSREVWIRGLQDKLGPLIHRSVEAECAHNDGGKWRRAYEYIVKERAKAQKRPADGNDVEGNPIIFDEGHDGMSLADFHALARETKGEAGLNVVEVAILRMYTAEFYEPWNNALRGLTERSDDDQGEGLKRWATCIAVLFAAVIKLSGVLSKDPVTGKSITRVWRGVGEKRLALPQAFYEATPENQGYPGGAEPAFSSTTTDIFTAYSYSGGWEVPGTILEIAYDAASRGADVQFLSCYPRERELLLPPFCMFSTHGVEERGLKRFIKCSITFNPGAFELAIENFTDSPKISHMPRGRRGTRAEQRQWEMAKAFLESVRATQPDFLCPFNECVFDDPVVAEDGKTYERSSIEAYIRDRKEAGLPIVSPTKHTPMGESLNANNALRDAILKARNQHEKLMLEAEMIVAAPKPGKRPIPKRGSSSIASAASAASAGAPAGDASDMKLSTVDELGEIFESLDSLSDFLPASLENWQTPSFVVLGSESSGKSTLLERLSMKPMFPRGEGICTRMAIKVELRRTLDGAEPPQLQVVDVKTQQPLGPKMTLALNAGDHDINEAMQQQIRIEHKGLVGVSLKRMLVLRVCSPSVPSLDLIDLPGLVNTRREGEPEDMAEQTKELISSFIEAHKAHAMFLVIVPAAVAPNTAPILELVQKYQIEGQCIGVFTKCDDVVDKVLKRQVKERLLMTASDAFRFYPSGWVATMNEPVEDEEGKLTPAERIEKQGREELRWFSERLGSVAELSGKVGCNALVETMRDAFFRYVKDTWAPAAIFQLDGEEARLRKADEALGLPAAHTQLQGGQLEQLKAAAKAAATEVLDKHMENDIRIAHLDAFDEDKCAASEKSEPLGLSELSEWVARRRREVHEATHRALKTAVARVRDRLQDDSSAFRLCRLPAFIDAVVAVLDRQFDRACCDLTRASGGIPSVGEMLDDAIGEVGVGGWMETCAAERTKLDECRDAVDPAKRHIVNLLGEEDAAPILQRAHLYGLAIDKWKIGAKDDGWRRCVVGRPTSLSILCRSAAGEEANLEGLDELVKSIVVDLQIGDDDTLAPTDKAKVSLIPRKDGSGLDVQFCPLAAAFRDCTVEVECKLVITLHRGLIGEVQTLHVVPDGVYDPIEKAIAALNDGPTSEKASAAELIRKICIAVDNPDKVAAVVKAGAIPVLVGLLKTGNAKLKEDAAASLAGLMFKNEPNKKAIADAQAIGPLVQLMKSGTAEQKEHSCRALCNLANPTHRPTMVKLGAIGPVVALARDGTTDRQKEYALAALCNLTLEKSDVEAVVKVDGLAVLVAAQHQGATARHKESAQKALENIEKTSKDLKKKVDAAVMKHRSKNHTLVLHGAPQERKCKECGCKEWVDDNGEEE